MCSVKSYKCFCTSEIAVPSPSGTGEFSPHQVPAIILPKLVFGTFSTLQFRKFQSNDNRHRQIPQVDATTDFRVLPKEMIQIHLDKIHAS